jgi:hypothetical protein
MAPFFSMTFIVFSQQDEKVLFPPSRMFDVILDTIKYFLAMDRHITWRTNICADLVPFNT